MMKDNERETRIKSRRVSHRLEQALRNERTEECQQYCTDMTHWKCRREEFNRPWFNWVPGPVTHLGIVLHPYSDALSAIAN